MRKKLLIFEPNKGDTTLFDTRIVDEETGKDEVVYRGCYITCVDEGTPEPFEHIIEQTITYTK
jgi:hypothetical protein